MYTYSLYNSTVNESTSLSLSGTPSYFNTILDTLPDNLSKLITPRDLRDMCLSLWSDVVFKENSSSSVNYIGIDTGNPSGNDLKKKIYFGKRYFNGNNIVATSSLSSDVDIFLYNTKVDTVDQDTTKISLLSGTNFNNFGSMPYFQSQFVTGLSDTLSLDFVNKSGDINVSNPSYDIKVSGLSGSTEVSFAFPTVVESYASASNNKVLKYDETGKKLYWDDIALPSFSSIGATGTALPIYGDPILVNNYPLSITDDRKSSLKIGDIDYGSTFSNVSISEVLRRMIYDYLPPSCTIKLLAPYSSGYVEVGTYPTPTLEFTIFKKTLPTSATLINMIPGVYPPITDTNYITAASSSNGVVISPITASTTTFTIQAYDGVQTGSAQTTITGVYPYFYGFSSVSTMTTVELANLTKKVEPFGDKIYDFTGSGNMYFIYPKNYGTLSNIFDAYGNTCSASFSATSSVFSSPTGLWASEEFWVYQWNGVSQIGPPSLNFEFRY